MNDAFAAAHRAHASIVAITRHLQPAAAGLLMQQELSALGRILESPERPLVAILGGAKVSDKLALVEHLLERVDALLIGGGMAFTFLLALGHAVGRSLVESDRVETARAALEAARRRGVRLVLPLDTVVAERADSAAGRAVGIREIPAEAMGLDIGPRTAESFAVVVRTAKTVVWNGPMGVFERPPFAAGTLAVARAVAEAPGFSVVGGGDTIAALATAYHAPLAPHGTEFIGQHCVGALPETLIVETPSTGVTLIRLNRPEALNALNGQLLSELLEGCRCPSVLPHLVLRL